MPETNAAVSDTDQDDSTVVPMVSRAGRLADALKRARAREQDRQRDALALREGRLAALADELAAMADELPRSETERFALLRAEGAERVIVDPLSYVDLHPQTLDYRLVRLRRDGPDILAELADRDAMADRVADYVAEQIVDHEGLTWITATGTARAENGTDRSGTGTPDHGSSTAVPAPASRFWPGFWLFVLGGVLAVTALFTYAWLAAGPS